MRIFSEFFWILLLLICVLMIFSLLFLWMTERCELLKLYEFYFAFLICLITISRFCEQLLNYIFEILQINIILDIELILINILMSVLYFLLYRDYRSPSIIFVHSVNTILSFHIILVIITGEFVMNSIILTLIGLLIFAIIIPYDKEYKTMVVIGFFSLFVYIMVALDIVLLGLGSLGTIFFIILISNETFRNRIISIYQTIIVSLKRLGSFLSRNYKKTSEKESSQKNKKILFWQARVKILQGTLKQEPHTTDKPKEEEKTWLRDFFSNKSRYGIELVSHKDFNWTFFIKSRSEDKARVKGEALLTRLLSVFPGMDAELEMIPITRDFVFQNNHFWEIKLPKPPYLEKFTLIQDFINVFHRSKQEIKLYIMWKKASPHKIESIRRDIKKMKFKDDEEKKHYMKMWEEELFKVRIFISYQVMEEDPVERELELQRIEGRLQSLTMSSRNLKKAASLRRVISGTQGNILRGNLFSGGYITPYSVDFDIPEFIPVVKPFVLENENFKYVPKDINDPNYILIGRHINRGRRTQQKMLIQKNSFAQSALLAGQQGTGKTFLLAQIVNEFYRKAPEIGILILNLGKGNQERFYKTDKVIKFGDPNFKIPYFVKGSYLARSIQETASYLIASTGLKNIAEKNMVNVMQAFMDKKGKLPRSLMFLFKELIRYFKQYPYHVKFQTNILRALKNRVLSLLANDDIKTAIDLSDEDEIPQWFIDWRNGKKIYLDMSMCNIYEKRLLTSAIFQLIRALTPDKEVGKLKNIILIDEAHQILEKPITTNHDDDDFISREQLEKIFNELLREFRSKGMSFILSDQTPSRLFTCVTTLPSLKILFRVGHPCNTILIGNPKEQDLLMLQKNRQALVLNGVSGEKYIIETLDYVLPDTDDEIYREFEEFMEFCPYCKTSLEIDAEFCNACGNPLFDDLVKASDEFNLDL